MPRPNRFHLGFDGRLYTVAVDGHDVTEHVVAVDLHSAYDDLPRVVLQLRPTATWPMELDVLSRVEIGAPPDPGPAAAEFLAALDPVEVERAALARIDLENVPAGGTAAVLRQLVEWARGA
jgi:hypothetical protein